MPRQPKFASLLCYLWPIWAFCAPREIHAATSERYAALECQKDGAFVIVNFYPDRTLQLTWGKNDEITEADINVNRAHSADREIYTGQNLSLSLSVGGGENSITPRIGEFRVSSPTDVTWPDLRCFLYGAD
jgi:hypothetical protein